MKIRKRSGQSTVEYMLLISVVVIAIVAAAYVFIPYFQEGTEELGGDVKEGLATGNLRLDEGGGGP